ncbi:hypothetical protein K493DRAFT_319840 [Basidiobolus meristosporus CBS 931.73]|uniref:ornithine decarboxylase n=1 Tax=Basidiobolus meristosporus CBS 931.73 TaxID=1314790 RepID=A0A1Y1XK67_9FUNG|nr:hypothetical protein K493DRAFT_319840 [Basidiobolus meristosporus CBS 931.73]|eukprot:ORX86157.1 hypothetical protein K493DRAFT_319840 [Basidiobolus meristosporus CBS 931.73]
MKNILETVSANELTSASARSDLKSRLTAEETREPIEFGSVAELMAQQVMPEDASEEAFFVADLGEVYRQYVQWHALLPSVEPFYAVKCNPDPMILHFLAKLGVNFDCASLKEIEMVLSLGVDPCRIIFANPCKQASHIRFAYENGITMMTFDNADELHKIKRIHPTAQLVLRVLTDDSKALCKLGLKFGASLDVTGTLLQTAKDLDLDVIGVSFHVGSGCYDAGAFADAVHRARFVFDQGMSLGFNLNFLDIGGGFPSPMIKNGPTFPEIAAILRTTLAQLFPPGCGVRIIAEPGRYFVSSAFTLACNVMARRMVIRDSGTTAINTDGEIVNDSAPTMDDHPAFMYYINDGVYGSFNCIMFDHQSVEPLILKRRGVYAYGEKVNDVRYDYSMWGPTCDSIDCIVKSDSLPELNIGDWVYFENMGAYTMCAASQFNGFQKSNVLYTTTEQSVLEHF